MEREPLVLDTLATMEARAIERIRHYCKGKKVVLAFSYGKDSCVIYHLAKLSGVEFEARFRPTSIDPPELLRWGRKAYPNIVWEPCRESFYSLIVRNGTPPGRKIRYCCKELKEGVSIPGGVVLLGIRWAESVRRKNRRMFEVCLKRNEQLLSPIIDWTDAELWRYIKSRDVQVSPLYSEGFERVGCIACPMAPEWKRRRDLDRWPHVRQKLVQAFSAMLAANPKRRGDYVQWADGESVLEWWLSDHGRTKPDGGLCRMWSKFDDEIEEDGE